MMVGVFKQLRQTAVLCELSCACSDCAAVLLIFNGKWLRFLSEPLELADTFEKRAARRRPSASGSRPPVDEGGRGSTFKVISRPLLRKYSA